MNPVEHEGFCTGLEDCGACTHRVTGQLKACKDLGCGYLPDCAGNAAFNCATAQRKLDAIADGSIHQCCIPILEEYERLVCAAEAQEDKQS